MPAAACEVITGQSVEELNVRIAEEIARGGQPVGAAYAVALPFGAVRHAITMTYDIVPPPVEDPLMVAEGVKLENERRKLDAAQEKLDAERAKPDADNAKLDAAQEKLDTERASLDERVKMNERAKLNAEQARLDAARAKPKADHKKLDAEQAKLDAERTKLETAPAHVRDKPEHKAKEVARAR